MRERLRILEASRHSVNTVAIDWSTPLDTRRLLATSSSGRASGEWSLFSSLSSPPDRKTKLPSSSITFEETETRSGRSIFTPWLSDIHEVDTPLVV
jgi:hypothetical protein